MLYKFLRSYELAIMKTLYGTPIEETESTDIYNTQLTYENGTSRTAIHVLHVATCILRARKIVKNTLCDITARWESLSQVHRIVQRLSPRHRVRIVIRPLANRDYPVTLPAADIVVSPGMEY